MPLPKRTAGRKRFVVHLGNVGYAREPEADKTRRYAQRFPNTYFIGIDHRQVLQKRPKNWLQIQTDFNTGLKSIKDNSLSIISSEMALGHYGPRAEGPPGTPNERKYTQKTLKTAYAKLKKGGKIMLAINGETKTRRIKRDLERAGFAKEEISVRELKPEETLRSRWTRLGGFQIIAKK